MTSGTASLGLPRLHLRRTGSTNERAVALAKAGAPNGTLVTASEQTAGRGRQGRAWSAPPGRSLLMSLVLREPPRLLPLSAALAVTDVAGGGARIKWPNDVLLEDRKLAGILVEGRPQEDWAVLGVGVNVAVRIEELPAELRARAATLSLEPADVDAVLGRLLAALETRLAETPDATLRAFRERDALVGRPVSWTAGSGTAEGIDGDGRLVVRTAAGERHTLDSGEVHLGSGREGV